MKLKRKNSVVARLRKAISNNYIKIPENMEFELADSEKTCYISISPEGIISNMQDDIAAFEGWATVIYRWLNPESIVLSWDYADVDNGHYQRFLYRVIEFHKAYDWFYVDKESEMFLGALKVKDSIKYYVNTPIADRASTDISHKDSEAGLEMQIYKYPDALKQYTNAVRIDRQLPVGLFETPEINEDEAIFTSKKSAIDLWGIDKDNNLLIFELKKAGNKKVGIISELFFYATFSAYIRDGIFISKTINSFEGLIKAYFLAPELHPLIDSEVINILNKNNSNISYIVIDNDNFDKLLICK